MVSSVSLSGTWRAARGVRLFVVSGLFGILGTEPSIENVARGLRTKATGTPYSEAGSPKFKAQ